MKKESGITLIALVISIIVLLILATVSIQTLIGNNGLLTKAEHAIQSNEDAQEEEKIKLAVTAAQLAGRGTLTNDNLNKELNTYFNNGDIDILQLVVHTLILVLKSISGMILNFQIRLK